MSVAVSLTLSIVNTNNRDLLRHCLQLGPRHRALDPS